MAFGCTTQEGWENFKMNPTMEEDVRMKIISVDPGKTGALVVIDNGYLTNHIKMPVTKMGSKTRPSAQAIAEFFYVHNPDRIILEQVGASPLMGSAGAFSFGYSFGVVVGVVAGVQVPCHFITPQKWKTFHGLIGKPKDASRLLVIEKYPDMKETFKRKNSVDTADAFLRGLAWLALDKLKKGKKR